MFRIAVTEFLIETVILLVITNFDFVAYLQFGVWRKDTINAVAKAENVIER